MVGSAEVEFANAPPLMWKVLFVEPWTAGHAPVASVNQPAPVFGGAWVRRPWPEAYAPLRSSSRKPGVTFSSEYFSTASCRRPSDAKKSSFPPSRRDGRARLRGAPQRRPMAA